MNLIQWFLDTTNNTLVLSEFGGGIFTPPAFYQGDVIPLELVLLQANPNGGRKTPYTVLLDASYSVKVALTNPGAVAASQFASVNLLFDGVRSWIGQLALNTPEIVTLVTASNPAACKLEIEITTGTGVISTELMIPATVLADGIKTGVPEPIPGETFVTSSQFANEAVKKVGEPGQGFTLVSEDGLRGFETRLVKDPVTGQYKVQTAWIDY